MVDGNSCYDTCGMEMECIGKRDHNLPPSANHLLLLANTTQKTASRSLGDVVCRSHLLDINVRQGEGGRKGYINGKYTEQLVSGSLKI